MSTSFARPATPLSQATGFHTAQRGMPSRPWPETTPSPVPAPFGFALFILVNAVLFIRPAEVIPALLDLPVDEVLILCCLVFSLPAVLDRLRPSSLATQPISVCVLGLLVAVVLSQLSHFQFGLALGAGKDFLKVVLYYLLFVSLVTSFARLRSFLSWLVLFIVVLTVLALLQWHGIISIEALEAVQQRQTDQETGEMTSFPRLCSTGLYHDPNDLCLILLVGMAISLYLLGAVQAGRASWRGSCLCSSSAMLWPSLVAGLPWPAGRGPGAARWPVRPEKDDAPWSCSSCRRQSSFLAAGRPRLTSPTGRTPLRHASCCGETGSNSSRSRLCSASASGCTRTGLLARGTQLVRPRLHGTRFFRRNYIHRYVLPGSLVAPATESNSAGSTQSRGRESSALPSGGCGGLRRRHVSLSRGFITPTYMIPALARGVRGVARNCPVAAARCFDARLVLRLLLLGVLNLVALHVFVRVFAGGA